MIFSIPDTTSQPAATAISTPRECSPVTENSAYSPPASIAVTEENEAITTPVRTAVLSGRARTRPAIRNSASRIAMKTAEKATFRGAVSPKNSEISLPEANPAPMTVPIYRKQTLSARHIRNYIFRGFALCRSAEKPRLNAGSRAENADGE